MNKNNRLRELIPPWEMPSEPVQAVRWFLHWFLKILVRFFWLPLLVVIVLEVYLNGRSGGVFNGFVNGVTTLFVGLVIWAVLYGVLIVVNVGAPILKAMSDMRRIQQQQRELFSQSYTPFMDMNNGASRRSGDEGRVVEGTISEVDEEQEKRRT